MLFNSHTFLFAYLPVVFAGFFLLARYGQQLAAAWLALASLFFYGWWNPEFVSLLLASILFNYGLGITISRYQDKPIAGSLLAFAVTSNLLLLGVFKYTNFFIDSFNDVAGTAVPLTNIVLPLGISFFTFTQIAFLVDARRGIAHEYNFIHYLLFVTYFPHLIAGPVLHHKQMMPQFGDKATYRIDSENITIGLTIFIIGLFKKVILADGVAEYASPVFNAAEVGKILHPLDAWAGTMAYTLQIYFDFSGYSDMAIGISRLFNVKLPLNFHSPYKAFNIIDFWRRWHMTLSQFLRDYLYFSLGGNRYGKIRRYRNLFLTMLLGGIWHGAGWNFAIWGALHGSYLIINHAWRATTANLPLEKLPPVAIHTGRVFSLLVTFLAVMVAWVFFRAQTLAGANHMVASMFDLSILVSQPLPAELLTEKKALRWFVVLLTICWFLPNTQEFMRRHDPAYNAGEHTGDSREYIGFRFEWNSGAGWMLFMALLASVSILSMNNASEFLYFQF